MADPILSMDLLADAIKSKMAHRDLSLRSSAEQIGCSPSTLSRVLQGRQAESTPDTATLIRITSWLGKSLADFSPDGPDQPSDLTQVFVHLRALPDLDERAKEYLVQLVRSAHDQFSVGRRAPQP